MDINLNNGTGKEKFLSLYDFDQREFVGKNLGNLYVVQRFSDGKKFMMKEFLYEPSA